MPQPLGEEQGVEAIAWRIVSDIALYHQGELRRAVDSGEAEALQVALAEGRRMLAAALGDAFDSGRDPIGDAYAELLEVMRAQNGG